jgi:hypothetical protein
MKKYILPVISTLFFSMSALAQFMADELNLKPKYSHSIHTNIASFIPVTNKEKFNIGYSRFSSKNKSGFRFCAGYVYLKQHEAEFDENIYNLKNSGGFIEGEWYLMSNKHSDKFIGFHYSLEMIKTNWIYGKREQYNISFLNQSEISRIHKIHFVKQKRILNNKVSADIGYTVGYNFTTIDDTKAKETTDHFSQNNQIIFNLFGNNPYANVRDGIKASLGLNLFVRVGGTWKTNQKTK